MLSSFKMGIFKTKSTEPVPISVGKIQQNTVPAKKKKIINKTSYFQKYFFVCTHCNN